jgi:hypothetical protein
MNGENTSDNIFHNSLPTVQAVGSFSPKRKQIIYEK